MRAEGGDDPRRRETGPRTGRHGFLVIVLSLLLPGSMAAQPFDLGQARQAVVW
jgi:hypothetical protein